MARLIASISAMTITIAGRRAGASSGESDDELERKQVAIAGATRVTDCISTSGRRSAPAWRSVSATSTSSPVAPDADIRSLLLGPGRPVGLYGQGDVNEFVRLLSSALASAS